MASDPFAFLKQEPVLICGAGPTGLVAALWLQKLNVPFRIIDPALKPGTTTRAMIVHARILEFYSQLGFVDDIIAAGRILRGMQVYSSGMKKGEIQYQKASIGINKYPHILSLGQDTHEQILNRIAAERGITIERGVKLAGAIESDTGVDCDLENIQSSTTENFKASYLIGCDGAHSATRKAAGLRLTGGTYANRAYVTDVSVESTEAYDGNFMNINLGQHVFCIVIPYSLSTARIIGFVPPDQVDEHGELIHVKELKFSDIEDAIRQAAPTVKITGVEWFSTYRVHHRIANSFRSSVTPANGGTSRPGRIFICGDAGHLHSPVGGQGMNTGIGDATNLAWKIAAVQSQTGPSSLLETYEPERRSFAEKLVKTTDTAFQYVNDQGWRGWFVRNVFMPYIFVNIIKLLPGIQSKMFKTVSQLAIAYPDSLLSTNGTGTNGLIKAGDRLPWVQIDSAEGGDNLTALQTCQWQGHVYGSIHKPLIQMFEDRGIALKQFDWCASGVLACNMHEKGLGQDVLYLVRPDGQVGLICAKDDDQVLARYLDRWEIGTQTR